METEIKQVTISYDEWKERFKPQINHLLGENNAPIDGYMYETYDQEIDYVKSMPSDRIWTVIDNNDGGNMWVTSGIHWVNRMGYIVTEVAVPKGEIFDVEID